MPSLNEFSWMAHQLFKNEELSMKEVNKSIILRSLNMEMNVPNHVINLETYILIHSANNNNHVN